MVRDLPHWLRSRSRRQYLASALVLAILLCGVLKVYDSYAQHQEAEASASASAYASAQASATNAVPDGIQVCEILDSTDLEELTGLQIVSFAMVRDDSTFVPVYSCRIYFAQPNSNTSDTILISYTPIPSPERPYAEYISSLADNSEISPVSMNDLPGEAFSYTIDGAERVTWRSPEGAQVDIYFTYTNYTYTESIIDTADPEGAHEILLHIFYQVAPIIDEVAAGPHLLGATFYPSRPTP